MKTLLPERCQDPEADQSINSSPDRSFSRHPSLADIPAITSNCSSSPIMTREKELNINRDPKSDALDSDIAMTENSIALLASKSHDFQRDSYHSLVPATPPKPTKNQGNTHSSSTDEPLTPTANLKMLVSAASPAIRDRESKKRELFTDSGESEPPSPNNNPCVVPSFALPIFDSKVVFRNGNYVHLNTQDGSEKMVISRKDKSLGLLCQRFLAKYPENPLPDQRIEISLDEVAKDLSVERRRIYDIVNVLESVEVISRFAKNRYMWHGKTKLPQTLAKLKHYAMTHGFTNKGGLSEKENPAQNLSSKTSNKENPSSNLYCQLKGGKNEKLPHLLPKNAKVYLPGMGCLSSVFDNDEDEMSAWTRKQKEADYCRKDKSLGVLSQKFLMMFLISESRQVTLDDAANLLIDEQEEGKAKYKTKVRRLYDIANILSSLQLIQKVHIHNIQSGRKPGFRWIGMDLDKLEIEVKQPKESSKPKTTTVSKNSLVEKNPEDETACCRFLSRRPSQQQLRATKTDRGTTKNKLPRSRSDRVLTCKKKVLSSESENIRSSEEDGYSVQEIIGIKANNVVSRSPDSVKFHTELMKLKEQYPDRMSQLLSACTTIQGISPDDKKSRRTLFVSEAYIDAPMPKRRRSSEDSEDSSSNNDKFVHSFTSPFKPFNDEKSNKTPSTESQQEPQGLKQGSPEQKILLERKKQAKLLAEQKDFQLEDERWKRMEHELDKAFPKNEPQIMNTNTPNIFDKLYPSVGIQASLIADISPLKPLRQYVHSMQIPAHLNGLQVPTTKSSPTSSSFKSLGLSPLVNNYVSETAVVPATTSDVASGNVKLVSLSSANLPSIWKMSTCSMPSMPTTQPIYLTMPQRQLSSGVCNNANLPGNQLSGTTMQPAGEGMSNCFGNIMQASTAALQPSAVTLPMNIVSSLNAQGLLQNQVQSQDGKSTRPILNLPPPQAFTPRMTLSSVPNISGARPIMTTPNQMTPILPKVSSQHTFSPMTSATPGSNAAFLHSEIAKKLVMPEAKLTQS